MSLELSGLDGTNPLGFLAALGLFRVISEAPGLGVVRLGWTRSSGTWTPRILAAERADLDAQRLLELLDSRLVTDIGKHPARMLEDLESAKEPSPRRTFFEDSLAPNSPTPTDWLAAFASDFAEPEETNQIQTARRDYFYGNIASVLRSTTRDHLRRSILHPWDYADPLDNQSLHFDPGEDRRHAYQWSKPAGDPARKRSGGMIGANRLAIEALPIMTSLPMDRKLRTLGFTGSSVNDKRWTWPIWSPMIPLDVAKSVLASAVAQKPEILPADVARLRAQGVVALYRTRRILVGKTPNFTPAQRIA